MRILFMIVGVAVVAWLLTLGVRAFLHSMNHFEQKTKGDCDE